MVGFELGTFVTILNEARKKNAPKASPSLGLAAAKNFIGSYSVVWSWSRGVAY